MFPNRSGMTNAETFGGEWKMTVLREHSFSIRGRSAERISISFSILVNWPARCAWKVKISITRFPFKWKTLKKKTSSSSLIGSVSPGRDIVVLFLYYLSLIAPMASSSNEEQFTKRWADICLEDEEEHEALFDDDCIGEEETDFDDRWCLVGRLLSGKVSDFKIFQNIMADLWKSGKGITIKILDQNRFLFQFYHEIDIQRVIDGSP
ncbi:hypothetical protein G4B88_010977 [Cannabis sativa]|uniref:DUF4283 domain-containing protein n=1 Tax=Cannabis sativa TaxID=3483 RepID=A0A7J6HJT8_CANSA|nr:hypothetical protein G4B88_010977 [Cannabis sativa]